jgi:hypothetical protein
MTEARGLEQRDGAVAVLQIGAVGLQHERAAVGVDRGVTLAAFNLLAGVIAARGRNAATPLSVVEPT